MMSGQLIKHDMRTIFCYEKSYTKCDRDTIPRPFSNKSKLSISLDQFLKFHTPCFYGMPSGGLSEYI